MIRWFQTWVRQKMATSTGVAPTNRAPQTNDFPLIDVAHEVLSKESVERGADLRGLQKFGWPLMKRRKNKDQVRAKVKKFLSIPLRSEDAETIIDEITEKITEAAETDPRLSRLFEDSK